MMMYDLLRAYKAFLLKSFRPTTAEMFYKKLCILFEGQSISDTVGKLDIDKILNKLGQIKHKNYFSQYKNAFLHFCEFQGINLTNDCIERIKELETATRKKRRQLKSIEYSEMDNMIKRIRDKQLKLSYQTIRIIYLLGSWDFWFNVPTLWRCSLFLYY